MIIITTSYNKDRNRTALALTLAGHRPKEGNETRFVLLAVDLSAPVTVH
jgi:hypothetical protein